jgi:hypothetical protein
MQSRNSIFIHRLWRKYVNEKFVSFCNEMGIKRQLTQSYTPNKMLSLNETVEPLLTR